MTDYEEQKMIEEARAGDPKAKYEMSQWARQMSILEPSEERWNRLAAKCLVESAQAGYEPAKQMVQELIRGQKEAAEEAPAEEAVTGETAAPEAPAEEAAAGEYVYSEPIPQEEETAWERENPEDEDEDFEELGTAEKILQILRRGAAAAGAFIVAMTDRIRAAVDARRNAGEDEMEDEAAEETAGDEEDAPLHRGGSHSAGGSLTDWINDNWKILRIICIAVCVAMALLIVLLLVTPGEKEALPEPTPVMEPTPTAEPTPTPEPFPNAATRTEISTTSTLSYRPSEEEFLTASASFTVDSDDGMNMRSGPSTEYTVLNRLDDELRITAYAKHSSGEETWYLINTGGTWGWVIADYLAQ